MSRLPQWPVRVRVCVEPCVTTVDVNSQFVAPRNGHWGDRNFGDFFKATPFIDKFQFTLLVLLSCDTFVIAGWASA